MRYKDVCSWIKKESEKLPEEAYFAREYFHKAPEEESDVPMFMDDKTGRVFLVEQHKVNHSRRLKRIWKSTKSFVELDKYFNKFGLALNIQP